MNLKTRLFGKNVITQTALQAIEGTRLPDYYLINVACKNCNMTTNIYVKKGVHLNDIVNGAKCSYCACRLEKI